MSLKRKPATQLERARAARAEDIGRRAGWHAKSCRRACQIIAVPAQIGDVENVETLAEDRQPGPLGAQMENLGHSNILRIEAARKRKIGGQRNRRNHSGSGRLAGIGLVELVHQLNQFGLTGADAELVVADARKRRSAGFSRPISAIAVQVDTRNRRLDRPYALERGNARKKKKKKEIY